MSQFTFRKLIYLGLFIVTTIAIEITQFVKLDWGLLPQYPWLDGAFLLYIAAGLFLIPSAEIQFWASSLIVILQLIIAVVNVNLMTITGEIFFWDMIVLLQDATTALEGTTILDLSILWWLGSIFVLFQVAHGLILWKYKKQRPKLSRHSYITVFVSSIAIFIFGFVVNNGTYHSLQKEIENADEATVLLSDAYLYETLYQPESSLRHFGFYPYYTKGLSYFIGINTASEASDAMIQHYLEEGLYETNEYTGISEGNSVIMVLLESFEYFAIDEDLTPHLYQLFYEDGIVLSNYHSKMKTDVAEASSFFGSYPSTGSLFRNYRQNDYPTALPSMLKNSANVSMVTSFHNNVGSFYNRSKAHLHFGFDEHVDLSQMDLTDTGYWIYSDNEMVANQVESMIPSGDESFFTFITTFTMHGGYETRIGFDDRYAYFDSIHYATSSSEKDRYLRTYMAAAMDLDQAIGRLFDRLEETNRLDTTTLLFYADHTAYYYGFSQMMRSIDRNDVTLTDQYRLPAVIFDTKLKSALEKSGVDEIDKFATVNDFTPTILNLLGIEFNPNYYVGNDLFCEQESVIISRISGIFNDHYYTEDGQTVLYTAPGSTSDDWVTFQEAVALTMKKQQHLNLIYRVDYYDGDD